MIRVNVLSAFIFCGWVLFFLSCEGDCRVEEIEKYTWDTLRVEYRVDTFVQYSITEFRSEYESFANQVLHTVTVKNENAAFSNIFAVLFKYGYVDSITHINEIREFATDSVEILPKSDHMFSFYSQAKYENNFNNAVSIFQIPKYIRLYKRKDTLLAEKYQANSCKENIEALKAKYSQVKLLFESRKSN